MQSRLTIDKDYREFREAQPLSLRRFCLLRNSILTNDDREWEVTAGYTIILSEGCPANRQNAHFLLLSNSIRDDLIVERAKFGRDLV